MINISERISDFTNYLTTNYSSSERSYYLNLRQRRETNDSIIYIGFNGDHNCFVCSTNSGFIVYNTDPFMERFKRTFNGGIGVIELMGRSNIVAFVGGGNDPEYPPNQLIIWDDHQSQIASTLEYTTEILSVKCRNSKIMVVLYHKIYIYNFNDLGLEQQYETYANPNGVGDINLDSNIIAIPSNDMGNIRLENLETKRSLIIDAHHNDISYICFSPDGSLLATSSKRGTIIRIWNTTTGILLREFRRGIEPVKILNISFNSNNTAICVSSDKGTIHIYSLVERKRLSRYEKNRKSSLSFMSGLLPEYFSSEWSYFCFQVPNFHNGKCTFSLEDPNCIIIVTNDGRYYKYRIDKKDISLILSQSLNIS